MAKDKLRPYQVALIKEILPALWVHGSVVLQLPTGGGKTHIATEVARRTVKAGKRVWFVCHRTEILGQTAKAFEAAGVAHGIVKAGAAVEPEWQVQICSVGALARRLEKLPPPDLMLWDEAHHVVARTWAELKDRFGDAHHLGLTATPDRLDGTGLKGSFDHLICGPDTHTLIEEGHLSRYRLFGPTIPDMRQVRTKLGDYDKGDVEKEMTKPVLVGDVVEHYKRLCPDARAIAFAISVKASQAVVERFLAAGIPAQHVDAKTPPAERSAAVEALRDGTIKVLSNVELFTEGFDCPAVDAVILLRPTKSLAMYRQMIGRGLRTYDGKPATVILDHSGLVHEHGLPDDHIEWKLEGFSRPKEDKDGEGKPRLRRCPECTAIHEWVTECVECGHVYGPEERTIEEVYGTLTNLNIVRHGFESRYKFALRMHMSMKYLFKLIEQGMPISNDGYVETQLAEKWIDNNKIQRGSRLKAPKGFMNGLEFANFMGVARQSVDEWKRKGIPRNINGKIHVKVGKEWVEHQREIEAQRKVQQIKSYSEDPDLLLQRVGRVKNYFRSKKSGRPA